MDYRDLVPTLEDDELRKLAKKYETAMAKNKSFYQEEDVFCNLADWYGGQNEFKKAIELIKYGLKIHPDSTDLQVELSYLLLDTGDKKEAIKVISAIHDDFSAEVKILRATVALRDGKEDIADQEIENIEDKDDLVNLLDIIYLYLENNCLDKAILWLEKGMDSHAQDEPFINAAGDCYYAKGLYEKAAIYFNQLIDCNPYSAPSWLCLAKCYSGLKMHDKTIEACDYAIVSDSELIEAYLLKATSFQELGNDESALECYSAIYQKGALTPGFLDMYNGMKEVSKQEWAEALISFEKVLLMEDYELMPVMPDMYAQAAFCLHKLGKKRKAHQYCKKAYQLDPENEIAYLIEGRIYMEEEEEEKALKQWQIAAKLAPTANTWNEIGTCCMDTGHVDYAKIAYENILAIEPYYEGLNEQLTLIYIMLHDKENFLKFNAKCPNPIDTKELKKLLQMVNKEDIGKEVALYLKHIIKGIQ